MKSYVEIVLALAVILVSTPILFSQLPASVSAICTNWAGFLDTDCDGLADDWEVNGYDVNRDGTVDLTFPGANKDRKDIYVELDYMKEGSIKDHKPGTGVVQAVVDAFNAAPVSNPNGQPDGIRLNITVNEPIPHVDSITMWSGFDALKNTWFGENSVERSKPFTMQAKDNTYHYVLFIHKYNGGTSSGLAEIPGDDFIVSLGASVWGKNTGGHNVGSADQQKGTLMHELGHNLNLRHGGHVDENCKTNYLSIMSYAFQFPNYHSGRPLDYSRSQLNMLNENALVEQEGIIPASDPSGLRSVWAFGGGIWLTPPLSLPINPINWNKDGDTNDVVSANINNFGAGSGCTSTLKTPLEGHDDWENLIFWGVTGGWGNGTIGSNGVGVGNGTIDNATIISSSMNLANAVNMINTTTVGSAIDVTAIGNQTIGLNSSLLNSTNQGGGLNMTNATDYREGNREGLDEYNAENLVSSRIYLLESIIIEVDSLPDEDFKNKTSKVALLNSLRTIGDGFNSNSTDLAPSISGLTVIRNQTNSSVINPNTQNFLASQIDNFVEALKKQQ